MKLTAEKKYLLLMEISQKLRDTLDLDEILNHLLDTVKSVVKYDAAGIFVLNQDLVHSRGEQPKELIAGIARRGFDLRPAEGDAMLTYGKGVVGYVIRSGESVIIPDVRLDDRYVAGRQSSRSEIAVPILRANRAIGALNLESDQGGAYAESDLEMLHFFADAAAISIEKAMLHKQLVEKELVERQIQMARAVQLRLFPKDAPSMAGYDIAGVCIPADEIGGDYYDFIPLPRNRMGVAVADVSGHGIASALVMTAFRALLRTHARSRKDAAHTASAINRLLPEFTAESHFVTVVYTMLDPASERITYVSCGHPPPLLVHSDGCSEWLDCHGPGLGLLKQARYAGEELNLATGDTLVLYTDGVVELSSPQGKNFGNERLAEVIRHGRGLPAAELIQQVIQATRAFSNAPGYLDDFTLVIIRRE